MDCYLLPSCKSLFEFIRILGRICFKCQVWMRHKPAVCLLKNALQHEIQSEIIQQDSPVLFAAKLAEVPIFASFLT